MVEIVVEMINNTRKRFGDLPEAKFKLFYGGNGRTIAGNGGQGGRYGQSVHARGVSFGIAKIELELAVDNCCGDYSG